DAMAARTRTVFCPSRPADSTDPGCTLRVYSGGVSYTQVLTPTLIAAASYEVSYLDGFQANLYRSVSSLGYEKVPFQRTRQSLSHRLAYYIPWSRTGLQAYYRYYHDDWAIDAHMV